MPRSFTPVALSATLATQIADQIGAAIIEEQFAPGEPLREVPLATAFEVSRATVRDALRILESRGLVRILPQRGAQVAVLSTEELVNLFEIRASLLALASRRAAKHFEPAHRDRLTTALAKLRSVSRDGRAYARASAAMVVEVSRLSRNPQLAELIATFAQRMGRYARLGLLTQERRNRSLSNWKALVDAISNRKEDLADATHRGLALENRDAAIAEIERREKKNAAGRTPGAKRAAKAMR